VALKFIIFRPNALFIDTFEQPASLSHTHNIERECQVGRCARAIVEEKMMTSRPVMAAHHIHICCYTQYNNNKGADSLLMTRGHS
jgi:hypothetical protein